MGEIQAMGEVQEGPVMEEGQALEEVQVMEEGTGVDPHLVVDSEDQVDGKIMELDLLDSLDPLGLILEVVVPHSMDQILDSALDQTL